MWIVNKVIPQRRLKQAGMRWSVPTAQAVLSLRAKVENGAWHEVKTLVLDLQLIHRKNYTPFFKGLTKLLL